MPSFARAAPESTDPSASHKIDWTGLAALSLGLTLVVLALVQSEAWSTPLVIALALVGLASLLAFWLVEHRVRQPIVEFDLFRNGPYFGASAAAFCLVGSYWAVMFFQPQYLQDVRGFSWLLRRVLVFPVAVLEGLVTLIAPVAVLTELAVRRHGRQLLQVGAAGLAALALCVATTSALTAFGSTELLQGLSVSRDGRWVLSIPASVAALAGVLTAAGPRGRRRTVLWSWNLLWISLGIVLVTGQVSLSGAAVALLLGRVAGLGVRFASGVQSERAYGSALVAAIRRAGFDPARLVRVADADEHRMYDLTTTAARRLRVVVLDGDRQVVGALSRLWRSVRLRGIEGRSLVSLRQAVERTALLAYAARTAGVRTPQPLGIAEAQDSMLVVEGMTGAAVPLRLVGDAHLTDELLHAIWGQLRSAHDAGIAHRALTSDTILVEQEAGDPVVWLVGWDSGDVASTELARRMDLTQLVALLAVRVGPARAIESAAAVLPRQDIAAIGPLLQSVVLPQRTREEMRAHSGLLDELRSALVEHLPGTDVEPEQVTRFGVRTVLTVVLPVVAVVVILTSINVDEIGRALTSSDWRWSAVAFGLGLATYVGAGLTFAAFAPVRISLRSATLVHAVGAFVSLAAPAGVGSAALNLRLLTKRGVSASLAVATVALVQVSQFIVTIALLLLLSLVSGSTDTTLFAPGPGALIAMGAPVRPADLGYSRQDTLDALRWAMEVRARFTILRLAWLCGSLDELTEEIVDEFCE